jgi:hypothetical protein
MSEANRPGKSAAEKGGARHLENFCIVFLLEKEWIEKLDCTQWIVY